MEERKPWERQKGETRRAYLAFCCYRDLDPRERSQRKAADAYYKGKTKVYLGQISVWSSKYNWVKRCEAYDEYLDELKRQADLEALLEMSARQAQIGQDMQDLGNKGLQERLQARKIGEMNTLDIVRLTRTGAEIERLARGMPTQIVEEQGKIERDFIIINPPAEAKETEENPFEEGG